MSRLCRTQYFKNFSNNHESSEKRIIHGIAAARTTTSSSNDEINALIARSSIKLSPLMNFMASYIDPLARQTILLDHNLQQSIDNIMPKIKLPPMQIETTSAGVVVKSQRINAVSGVYHGFGVRGVTIKKYLDALGINEARIFETDQIHGSCVRHLRRDSRDGVLLGDAFITRTPGVVCFVRTADCVPILVADTKQRAVAAVHAGWRGTALDVAGEAIRAMEKQFGTNPADCVAAIGPRICGKCYEVGAEVIESLKNLKIGDGWCACGDCVDLGEANRSLLKLAGVRSSNISIAPHCTSCDPTFASWRRDRREEERQLNFIMIRNGET